MVMKMITSIVKLINHLLKMIKKIKNLMLVNNNKKILNNLNNSYSHSKLIKLYHLMLNNYKIKHKEIIENIIQFII